MRADGIWETQCPSLSQPLQCLFFPTFQTVLQLETDVIYQTQLLLN